jgi:hypothetical protein
VAVAVLLMSTWAMAAGRATGRLKRRARAHPEASPA